MKSYYLIFITICIAVILFIAFPNDKDKTPLPEPLNPELLSQLLPEADYFKPSGKPCFHYKGFKKEGTSSPRLVGVIILSEYVITDDQGYSGPIKLALGVDTETNITGITVLSHSETSTYVSDLGSFIKQFIGLDSLSRFRLGKDIDGISQATITSRTITRIVYRCVRAANSILLHLPLPDYTKPKPDAIPPAITSVGSEKLRKQINSAGLKLHDAKYWKKIN